MSRPKAAQPHENQDFCQIDIERGLVTSLRKAALQRGTNAPALLRDIISVVVTDRLVDAILDDQSC